MILSGSCAVFQCNDDELRRLRLSHKPSRRMSDGDWTVAKVCKDCAVGFAQNAVGSAACLACESGLDSKDLL